MATRDWVCTVETYVKLWFQKLKLWVVEKLKNQSSKSMCAHGSKFGVKTRLQNCQKLENVFGKIKIFLAQHPFSSLKIQFSLMAFRFLRNPRKSSSLAFQFLRRNSNFRKGFLFFLNGFPLSKKSGKIYQWRQVYERLLSKLCISAKIMIFWDKNNRWQVYKRLLSKLCIFHSKLHNSC